MRTVRKCPTPVLLTLLLVSLAAASAVGQEDPPADFDSALKALRAAGTLDDKAIGYAGAESKTWRAYKVFRDRGTLAQHTKLTDDANPIVRGYAFQALLEKHRSADIRAVLLRHLADTEEVETFEGCCRGTEKIGDVLIRHARYSDRLSEADLAEVVEGLVETDSPLDAREAFLRTHTFKEESLARIRKLAQDGDSAALVALARYRNNEDVPLIRSLLGLPDGIEQIDALRAATLFPHPDFLTALIKILDRAKRKMTGGDLPRLRFYYAALAAQENARAAAALTELLDVKLEDYPARSRAEHLHGALQHHRVKVYIPLLRRLWVEDGRVTPEDIRWLEKVDGEWVRRQREGGGD